MRYLILLFPMFAYGLTVDGQKCADDWSITYSESGMVVVCGADIPKDNVDEVIHEDNSVSIIDRGWPSIPRETLYLAPDEVLAIKIKTGPSLSDVGRINTAKTTSPGGKRVVSLSKTAGDFSPTGPCQSIGGEVANLSWTTIQNIPAAYINSYCKIQPDTTYYINIKHTNCSSNKCYFYLSSGG